MKLPFGFGKSSVKSGVTQLESNTAEFIVPARWLLGIKYCHHLIDEFVAVNPERIVMKIFQVAVCASLLLGSVVAQAADIPTINVTVGGEIAPGVYGKVQFGNAPPPPVVYAQPVVVVQQPRRVVQEPIYLHVPPGHAKNWSKHCQEYDACDRPVYFVKSAEYEPGYREHGDEGRRDHGRRGEGRGDEGRRDDYREEGRRGEGRGDEGRGRGRGREERD